jgi:hypothetical protein
MPQDFTTKMPSEKITTVDQGIELACFHARLFPVVSGAPGNECQLNFFLTAEEHAANAEPWRALVFPNSTMSQRVITALLRL